jgi:acetyl esterase/lipase
VLIAPWVDLTLTGPGVEEAQAHDPWLTRTGLIAAGTAWAVGDDPAQPKLSPINGSFDGLAPIAVYIGTRDLLLPDVLRLTKLVQPASVDLTVCPGGLHVYPLLPGPEGRATANEIVRRIRNPK